MNGIDPMALENYNSGMEWGRLHRGLGLIEFERTREILLEQLPPPPAVICDIGGAYGEYACFLAGCGYEVHLFDLSPWNIEKAGEFAERQGVKLASREVADARKIDRPDNFADAVLLFGPLYHLVEAEDRKACLKECRRLLKPGGRLFTANITCYAALLNDVSQYDLKPFLDDDDRYERYCLMVTEGVHYGKEIGKVHFHRPDELRAEVASAGFHDVELRGVIGHCWIIRNLDEAWQNPVRRESIMRVVRLLEKEESLMGFSTHFISMSRKE